MADERLAAIEARVASYVERAGIPAFALGIVRGDEVVLARGFGNVDDGGAPVTPDTLFPSCSTGKTFTGTALMRLVEQGVLHLDRPVVDTLPDLTLPRGAASAITLRHLLSHRSGLASDPEVPRRLFGGARDCLAEHVREDVPGYGPALPPDRVTWYSNVGFSIAGRVAEVATKTPFHALVRELVFDPLDMRGSSYDPDFRSDAPTVALPGWTARPPGAHLPIPNPAGGALTCVTDLARFALEHLNGGLLRPETFAEMHRAHGDAFTREPRRYGLAFDVESHRGFTLVTHGGGGFGCGSAFALVPEHGLGVIALFNHPAGYGVRVRPILDQLLDLSEEHAVAYAPAQEDWPKYAGTYACTGPPPPGYPDTLTVENGEHLVLRHGDRASVLRVLDEPVYLTDDGRTTVGFVPAAGPTELAMYDGAGIGLVSAWPYQRQGG